MKLFSTISIETSSKCTRKCKFCPNAYFERPNVRMNEETILDLLNQLRIVDYKGRIELYIYNEPTADPRIYEIISLARERVPHSCIMIATNGFNVNIEKLKEHGLNQLQINCYDDSTYSMFKELEGSQFKNSNNDSMIYNRISPTDFVLSVVDKRDMLSLNKVFKLSNRAGNIKSFVTPLPSPLNKMCVRPFRMMNVRYDGEVMICCNDFNLEVKIGNVREKTLIELWNSEVFRFYRRNLFVKCRDMPLCRACDFNGGTYQFNVPNPFIGDKK